MGFIQNLRTCDVNCCGGSCCLFPYPFNDDGSPRYPTTDLPDTVNVAGDGDGYAETYTLNPAWGDYVYSSPMDGSITPYDSTGEPSGFWSIVYPIPNPISGLPGDIYTSPCLIAPNWQADGEGSADPTVTDNFNNTYTVNGTDVITRTGPSSCIWSGAKTGGGSWDLEYGISNPYEWSLNGTAKTAPQSSPPGSYGADTVA